MQVTLWVRARRQEVLVDEHPRLAQQLLRFLDLHPAGKVWDADAALCARLPQDQLLAPKLVNKRLRARSADAKRARDLADRRTRPACDEVLRDEVERLILARWLSKRRVHQPPLLSRRNIGDTTGRRQRLQFLGVG